MITALILGILGIVAIVLGCETFIYFEARKS